MPGTEPQIGLFAETVNGSDYALAYVTPQLQPATEKRLPRDVVFVIDNSGSMGGPSMSQAKASLIYALDRLDPMDRFNVVRFDDTKWFIGRETPNRGVSRHGVEVCCRRPPAELERAWRDQAWPNVRTPRTLLATLPTGAFPGVDTTDLYEFLEAHAPE